MKPYCTLCKTDHEKWQAHVFAKANGERRSNQPDCPGINEGVAGGERPAFDRKTYQREYMRSYRKKQSLMLQTAKALLERAAEPWPRG